MRGWLGEGARRTQYRCPGCGVRTCSVACSREHKRATECTGVRPRSTYVAMDAFNDQILWDGTPGGRAL